MSSGKIDTVKLSQMLRAGKSQCECAKVFGVSEGAISQFKAVPRKVGKGSWLIQGWLLDSETSIKDFFQMKTVIF